MIGEILSGPMALKDLAFLLAFFTWSWVMTMYGSLVFILSFLKRFLNSLVGFVVCLRYEYIGLGTAFAFFLCVFFFFVQRCF